MGFTFSQIQNHRTMEFQSCLSRFYVHCASLPYSYVSILPVFLRLHVIAIPCSLFWQGSSCLPGLALNLYIRIHWWSLPLVFSASLPFMAAKPHLYPYDTEGPTPPTLLVSLHSCSLNNSNATCKVFFPICQSIQHHLIYFDLQNL